MVDNLFKKVEYIEAIEDWFKKNPKYDYMNFNLTKKDIIELADLSRALDKLVKLDMVSFVKIRNEEKRIKRFNQSIRRSVSKKLEYLVKDT